MEIKQGNNGHHSDGGHWRELRENDFNRVEAKSSYLSLLLQEAVGTPEMVHYRQDHSRMYEFLVHSDGKTNVYKYFTGSKAEGLDLPGSDIDFLLEEKDISIIQKPSETQYPSIMSRSYLQMVTDNVRPGFVLLRYLDNNSCWNRGSLQRIEGGHYVSSRLTMMNMTPPMESSKARKVQGPSFETYEHYSENGNDLVYCFKCPTWPEIADEWLLRPRYNSWPSNENVQSIKKFGCHVVPVGHPLSTLKDMEWRISFSLAERLLVWSFTQEQLQCYAFLKLFLKEYINSRIETSVLCSYFIKTQMFWAIEQNPASFWRKENTLNCFRSMIKSLLEHVVSGRLPHYFIPGFNLFEIKVKGKAREDLIHVLGPAVYSDVIDIMAKCQTLRPVWEKFVTRFDSGYLATEEMKKSLLVKTEECFMQHLHVIFKVVARSSHTLNFLLLENVFVSLTLKYALVLATYKMLGSASRALRNRYQYSLSRNILICRLCKFDHLTTKLLQASVFLYNRNFRKSNKIITGALSAVPPYAVYFSYPLLHTNPDFLDMYIEITKHESNLIRKTRKFWIFDLCFYMCHFPFVPAAIQIELQNCDPVMGVSVSPYIFAYYLQFLCFHGLGLYEGRDRALRQLIETANDWWQQGCLSMKYHSLNIAGHCLLVVGRKPEARDMFLKSRDHTLCFSPLHKYNSAIWYLGGMEEEFLPW